MYAARNSCLSTPWRVPWREYAVVGFTSTFEQNVASLAMARQVKHLSPETAIVFGGANWEGEMGLELHQRFRFVDYVCSGESERSFPRLVEQIFHGDAVNEVQGIVYRADGQSVSTGPPEMIHEMDQLPVPDFGDFFMTRSERAGNAVVPTLLLRPRAVLGAKHHGTFCGLNGIDGVPGQELPAPWRSWSISGTWVWKWWKPSTYSGHEILPRSASALRPERSAKFFTK